MALTSLLTQQAEIHRWAPGAVDAYGNDTGGTFALLTTVSARYEEMFGLEINEPQGRSVNIMRWRCFVPPTDVTVEDRIVNPETGQVFRVFALDREWGRTELHHLVLWLIEVDE